MSRRTLGSVDQALTQLDDDGLRRLGYGKGVGTTDQPGLHRWNGSYHCEQVR